MANLPDHVIRSLAEAGLATPHDPQLVNPASLDLRLGDSLLIESLMSDHLVPYPLKFHTREDPYLLQPQQFVLADTLERIAVPPDISAQVSLKSSAARLGLEHLMAGFIDPGYVGTITLELHNCRQLHPVKLWPGMRIVQLVLQRLESPPERDYSLTGRYKDTAVPVPSLGIPA